MSKIAKPLEDHEVEFSDEDDSSVAETKKAGVGFTPTQAVSWPFGTAKPPQKPLSAEDAMGRTRGEHAKTNRRLGNRDEAEKARQDDHRPDQWLGQSGGGSIEAKWAAGYTKSAGKHVSNPGLLTRGSGRLKVLPESVSGEQLDEWADRAPEFAGVAKRVLHGRDLMIFEQRILNPMFGRPKSSAEDLAAQLNITVPRVYNVESRCLKKVQAAFLRHKQGKSPAEHGAACKFCNRIDFSKMCSRGNYGPCSEPRGIYHIFGSLGLHHDLRPSPSSTKPPPLEISNAVKIEEERRATLIQNMYRLRTLRLANIEIDFSEAEEKAG